MLVQMKQYQFHKLIKLIFNTLKIKQKVILKKGHSGDTWGTYSDNKKLLSLGWKNKISLKIGLNKTINDLKKIK